MIVNSTSSNEEIVWWICHGGDFELDYFLNKMKIDFAIEKYLKYRKFVEKISTNTLKLHR